MTPPISSLLSDFKLCSPTAGSNWNRLQLNDDVRFCRWDNQFPDGKKYNTSAAAAFPWPGASDARCPVADEIIDWQVAECFDAFWRAWISPKAGTDEVRNYAVKLVDYLVNTLLTEELYEEVELAAQYRASYGWCLLHPTWELELDLEYREVSLAALQAAAQAARQQLASMPPGALTPEMSENAALMLNLPTLIVDPSDEARAADALALIYGHYAKQQMNIELEVTIPPVRRERLIDAVRELRDSGAAQLPVPYLCKNQPAIYALKPWDECFITGHAGDIQKGTVYRRVFMTEIELKAKIAMGWSEAWVTEALKYKGKGSTWGGNTNPATSIASALSSNPPAFTWNLYDTKNDLVEVLFATYKMLDEDNVPGVYLTVLHPDIGGPSSSLKESDQYAEHNLLGWGGGQLPYVPATRERWHRAIATSRGLPEVMASWQRNIKVNTDGAIDWMSIGVLPPINVYDTAMGTKYLLGPAIQNTVRMGKEPRFADVPSRGVPFLAEANRDTRRDIDAFVGRDNPLIPPGLGQSKRQKSVGTFTMAWTGALRMACDLCQAYMADAEFARVTGAPAGWLEANRTRRNLLAARLEFDIRELNPEYVASQLQAVNQTVIPGDVAGVTNRAKWTKMQWRMLNPMLARELVNDQGEASQQLFNQVKSDIGLMFIGQEADYVQMDPTADQKLKYTQQIVQANPNYVQALQGGKGRFAELLQKYTQNLQFSLTEEQNKTVGAIGVQPGPKA